MAILAIGSVAFDGIETPAGKRDRCLGGVGHVLFTGRELFY